MYRCHPGRKRPDGSGSKTNQNEDYMLYTIAVVLLVLWLLGMVSGSTMGGLIHALLVIAVVMVLVNLISRRRRA
jgi:Family of unknown function (DUF5670)